MFSSKAPVVSNDPQPYRYVTRSGEVRRARKAEDVLPAYAELDLRPEFNHVQHNPTNPILVMIREHPKHPEKWLFDILDDRFAYRVFGGFKRELEHAEKVIRKLIAISESEWKIQYGVYYSDSDTWDEYYTRKAAEKAAAMFKDGTVEWRKVTKWRAL